MELPEDIPPIPLQSHLEALFDLWGAELHAAMEPFEKQLGPKQRQNVELIASAFGISFDEALRERILRRALADLAKLVALGCARDKLEARIERVLAAHDVTPPLGVSGGNGVSSLFSTWGRSSVRIEQEFPKL